MFRVMILTKRLTTRFVEGQSVPAIEFGMQLDAGDPANQGIFPSIVRLYVDPQDTRATWDIGQVVECTATA